MLEFLLFAAIEHKEETLCLCVCVFVHVCVSEGVSGFPENISSCYQTLSSLPLAHNASLCRNNSAAGGRGGGGSRQGEAEVKLSVRRCRRRRRRR